MDKAMSFIKGKHEEYIQDLEFPATRDEIVSHAREKGAPNQVIERLQKLPDQEYDSMGDVMSSAGDLF